MLDYRTIIASFLRAIPQSNQPAKTLRDIAGSGADDNRISLLFGCAVFLRTFGVVEFDIREPTGDSLLRASGQTAKYALLSFASLIENDKTIISDWKTRGVEVNEPLELLDVGAKFLYALETRRVALIENPPATRFVKVSQVIIKRTNADTGKPEILFQFDDAAQQYQLIGGRWREDDGDDMLKTIRREIDEELAETPLKYPDDYQLNLLTGDLPLRGVISSTFGALSEYRFWVYHMTNIRKPLKIQAFDQWVPIDAILSGAVIDSNGNLFPFHSPEIYHMIDKSIAGGLTNLPDSSNQAL